MHILRFTQWHIIHCIQDANISSYVSNTIEVYFTRDDIFNQYNPFYDLMKKSMDIDYMLFNITLDGMFGLVSSATFYSGTICCNHLMCSETSECVCQSPTTYGCRVPIKSLPNYPDLSSEDFFSLLNV